MRGLINTGNLQVALITQVMGVSGDLCMFGEELGGQ